MMSINLGRLSRKIGQSEKPKELKTAVPGNLAQFNTIDLFG